MDTLNGEEKDKNEMKNNKTVVSKHMFCIPKIQPFEYRVKLLLYDLHA